MRLGIGLPNAIPGTTMEVVIEWARRADTAPLTSAGVLHRVAYDAHDPLEVLAEAAPATKRLRLVTMVAVAPLYDTESLAKRAVRIHEASEGRLTLGVSVGARTEDYDAAGMDHRGRGRRLDEQLLRLRELWEEGGDPVPPVLVGGAADVAFARMARWSDGYVHGGGPPRAFAGAAMRARSAWTEFGRPGDPQLWGQSYFVLGDRETVERGKAYMRDYYAFTGPFVERIVEGLLTTPQAIAQQARGYAEVGCDELVMIPAVSDLSQLDRLAEVVA